MSTLSKHCKKIILLIFINFLFLSVNLYATNKSDFTSKKYEFGKNIHDTSKVKLLNDISWKFLNNNLDSSFYYVNEAISISHGKDLLPWLAKSYNTLGVAFWYKGDLDSALYIFKQALAINNELGRSAETARNLGNIGMLHDNLGRLDSALFYYEESLNYFEENNDKLGIAKTYVNMALIHSDLKRYDKAIDYNDKAIKLYNEIKFKEDIPRVLGNKGLILVKNNELKNALTVFFEALFIAEEQNNLSVKAKILEYIGNTYTKLKQYDDAYEYVSKSIEIHRQLNEKISETGSLLVLGDLLINSKKFSIARDTLQKGLSMAKKLKNKNLIILALRSLSDVYLILEDYKNAYYAKEEFSIYNDSIINEKFAGQLAHFQTKYETEKKEKENELLKKENELKKRKISFLLLLFASFFILFVIIILLFLQVRKNTLNKKRLAESDALRLKERVDYQKRELTTVALQLSRQFEFENKLAEKMREFVSHTDEKGKGIIRRMINDIKHQNKDSFWNEFELRFKEVYSGFYETLQKKYPDLTANEIRLCVFLKLEMNTKDISFITFQSLRAIETARLRLRKKLGIPRDINLNNFCVEL